MWLRAVEARLLGSLVEKHLTTPQQYPLTINALVTACNQTTNRDPVVQFDESTVLSGIDELKQMKLARSVLPSHGRSAVRYRHVLDETLALNNGQCALIAVMLLRGPQTVSELRIRTERMAEFDDVGQELEWLASRDDMPLAVNLGRRPGQKEERWACPLLAESLNGAEPAEPVDEGRTEVLHHHGGPGPRPQGDGLETDRLAELETQVADLQAEVTELRQHLVDLKTSLGE